MLQHDGSHQRIRPTGVLSDIARAGEARSATESSARQAAMRLAPIDYATIAFVLMSVASGPVLMWILFGIAAS
jgi:hypothetical protein